jgi:hypothetical protein
VSTRGSITQRYHFGMAFTGTFVPTFTNDLIVFNQDATDPWVNTRGVQAIRRQLQCTSHPGRISGGRDLNRCIGHF